MEPGTLPTDVTFGEGCAEHRICPEAYSSLDDRAVVKLPGMGTAKVLISAVAILVAIVVAADLVVKTPWDTFVTAAKNYVVEAPPEAGG